MTKTFIYVIAPMRLKKGAQASAGSWQHEDKTTQQDDFLRKDLRSNMHYRQENRSLPKPHYSVTQTAIALSRRGRARMCALRRGGDSAGTQRNCVGSAGTLLSRKTRLCSTTVVCSICCATAEECRRAVTEYIATLYPRTDGVLHNAGVTGID